MATPALRRNFVDKHTPKSDELSAAEYNLNAQRTDAALDAALAAGIWPATGTPAVVAAMTDAESARDAISAQRQQAVDIRDYIISGTTFDIAAVIAAMETGNGVCHIPPGQWTPDAFNIALDETLVSTALSGTAKTRFTYKFLGAGKQSRLMLPLSMTTDDYLFKANSANIADFATHPKIVLEDLAVSGSVVGGVGNFMLVNQRSLTAKRLYLSNMINGFVATGYCDLVHVEQILAESMTAGGYVFTGGPNGDGYTFDQLMAYGSGCLNLTGNLGVSIRGCLSGWYKFTSCDVTFIDCHIEGDGSTTSTPVIQSTGSTINLQSGYYQPKKYRPFISINDGTDITDTATNLTVSEGVRWAQRLAGPDGELGAEGGVAIDVVNLSQRGRIHINNSKTFLYPQLDGGPGTVALGFLAPKITASGDAALQTLLDAPGTIAQMGGDFTILRQLGAWSVSPSAIPLRRIVNATFLSAVIGHNALWGTNLDAGTYYYRAYVVNAAGRWSQASSEVSVTTTLVDPLALLDINAYSAPSALRILRGTTTNTYTEWVEIPIARTTMRLTDQGTHIAGYEWSSTGVPSYNATANATVTGMYFLPTSGTSSGRTVFWNSAPPTTGDFTQGDVCWNSAPTAGGPAGWVCTVTGNPGTWAVVDTNVAAVTHAATSKTPPVDADELPLVDSAASNVLKKLTWANLKAALFGSPALTGSTTVAASGDMQLHRLADQTTNYERLRLWWNSTVASLTSEAGGTGTARDMKVMAGTNGGAITLAATASPRIELTANTNGADITSSQVTATHGAASNNQTLLNLAHTVAQSGTAGYKSLAIAVTETSTGSGAKKPISVTVGGTERFSVDNGGRITPRITAISSSATPSINTDIVDQCNILALATAITSMTTNLTGTPLDGQKLRIRIKDNGTARAIAWGASWRAIGVTLPTTTVISKTLYIDAVRNAADNIWDVLDVKQEA